MSKAIIFVAVLLTACTESTRDVSLSTGGYGGNSPGGGDAVATHVVTRDVAPREVAVRSTAHRDVEFVVCAQCRH